MPARRSAVSSVQTEKQSGLSLLFMHEAGNKDGWIKSQNGKKERKSLLAKAKWPQKLSYIFHLNGGNGAGSANATKGGNKGATLSLSSWFIILACIRLEFQTLSSSLKQHLLLWSVCQCLLAFLEYMGRTRAFAVPNAWSSLLSGPRHRAAGPQRPSNPETGPFPSAWRTGPSSDPQSGPRGRSFHKSASPPCEMPTTARSSSQTRATLQDQAEHGM